MDKNTVEMLVRLHDAGIDADDAMTLRRIAMTLHRWFELECGNGDNYKSWAIERDEDTDVPYMVMHFHDGNTRRYRTSDREKGAKKRLQRLNKKYPQLTFYIQTDPRGAPLYVLRPGDVPEGKEADSYYNRGLAVFK